MDIFGVPISSDSAQSIYARIRTALQKQSSLRVVTLNPEYLLLARKNNRFRESLLQADIRTIDGFGIRIIGWLLGKSSSRVTGADLLFWLLDEAQQRHLPVVFVLHPNGLSSEGDVRSALAKRWPNLQYRFGGAEGFEIVICNYGAPSQEFLLDEFQGKGIKIGVGGAVDYLTGKQKRAPSLLRVFGLEWLWRLIRQPKRIKRIWQAVIVFPSKALLDILQKASEQSL